MIFESTRVVRIFIQQQRRHVVLLILLVQLLLLVGVVTTTSITTTTIPTTQDVQQQQQQQYDDVVVVAVASDRTTSRRRTKQLLIVPSTTTTATTATTTTTSIYNNTNNNNIHNHNEYNTKEERDSTPTTTTTGSSSSSSSSSSTNGRNTVSAMFDTEISSSFIQPREPRKWKDRYALYRKQQKQQQQQQQQKQHGTTSTIRGIQQQQQQQQRQLQTTGLGQIDQFRLINAITDLPIITNLTNGTIINIATVGTSSFNLDVTSMNGGFGSIVFGHNTLTVYRSERGVPYSFCGDGSPRGNYLICNRLIVGVHNITATPYSGTYGNGTMGQMKSIQFQIVNIPPTKSPTKVPTKTPTMSPTNTPTKVPTKVPTKAPTMSPTNTPTKVPTKVPTKIPTKSPTNTPTKVPTKSPTLFPSSSPSTVPSNIPSSMPTIDCSIPKFTESGWNGYGPNYPLDIAEPMGLILDNDFVIISGFINGFGQTTNQTMARDITIPNSPWRRMDDVPVPISFTHAPLVKVGMKVYMCGGYLGAHPGPHTPLCFMYNHAITPGTWAQWTLLPSLPNNGYAGGGMIYDTIKDALYFAGGGQRLRVGSVHPTDSNRAFKLSLSNLAAGWSEITPVPYTANHLSSVTQVYDNQERHYFTGGQRQEYEAQQNLPNLYEFIASNESWVARTFMPGGRGHTTSSTRPMACGFITAGGSLNSITTKKNRTNTILYYDIPSDSWTYINGTLSVSIATPLIDVHSSGYMYYINNKGSVRRGMEV